MLLLIQKNPKSLCSKTIYMEIKWYYRYIGEKVAIVHYQLVGTSLPKICKSLCSKTTWKCFLSHIFQTLLIHYSSIFKPIFSEIDLRLKYSLLYFNFLSVSNTLHGDSCINKTLFEVQQFSILEHVNFYLFWIYFNSSYDID